MLEDKKCKVTILSLGEKSRISKKINLVFINDVRRLNWNCFIIKWTIFLKLYLAGIFLFERVFWSFGN